LNKLSIQSGKECHVGLKSVKLGKGGAGKLKRAFLVLPSRAFIIPLLQ
jgi:hypothetical protein